MKLRAPVLALVLLGLFATGSNELDPGPRSEDGCLAASPAAHEHAVPQLSLSVFVGSRLLEREPGRLELQRGALLPCTDPALHELRAELQRAAAALPPERLPRPLRAHLDPRLPAREAPLGGVEVHVSSRELLVQRAALPLLPAEAWRHELLHALAAPPPAATEVARRLWLTLEEGLVQYAAQRSGPAATGAANPREWPALPLPLWEQLALPAYDPHELASSWASELGRTDPLLSVIHAAECLSAAPGAARLDTLQQTAHAFARRCPASVAPVLQQALQRWLPEEWHGVLVQPAEAAAGVAAFSPPAR